eukprot:scaffold112894_cov36-Cyclotella_meneghiniana.AAC.1
MVSASTAEVMLKLKLMVALVYGMVEVFQHARDEACLAFVFAPHIHPLRHRTSLGCGRSYLCQMELLLS